MKLTAGCIGTDLPAGLRYSGQSGKPLIEIAHVHHAMWVMFTETRCKKFASGWTGRGLLLFVGRNPAGDPRKARVSALERRCPALHSSPRALRRHDLSMPSDK